MDVPVKRVPVWKSIDSSSWECMKITLPLFPTFSHSLFVSLSLCLSILTLGLSPHLSP